MRRLVILATAAAILPQLAACDDGDQFDYNQPVACDDGNVSCPQPEDRDRQPRRPDEQQP